MVKIKKNLVVKGMYAIKCPYPMTPKYVVIHNTANDATAANEISYMRTNSNEVSFHYAVDDKEIVQGIPENRNAWHAGDGGEGKGNRYGIAIEICYSKSGGSKFTAAEKNAAELAADILKRYGWGIDCLKKHQDFSGKYCPHRTLDMGWQRFVDMVNAHLCDKPAAEPETPAVQTKVEKGNVVTVAKGAKWYNGKRVPDWVLAEKWIVKSVSGDRAVIDKSVDGEFAIDSPISVNYLQLVAANTSAAGSKVDSAKDYTKTKVGTYKVKANGGLRLRAGASTSKAIIETMANGSIVTCYGYHTNDWLLVISAKGNTGFCHSDYLSKM